MAKLRESEDTMREAAQKYEGQATNSKRKLQQVKNHFEEELELKNQMESALRKHILLLQKDKESSLPSRSMLQKSIKTHPDRARQELKHVHPIASMLQKSLDRLSTAKNNTDPDELEKILNGLNDLKIVISKVEVAAEADKLETEHTFVICHRVSCHKGGNEIPSSPMRVQDLLFIPAEMRRQQ